MKKLLLTILLTVALLQFIPQANAFDVIFKSIGQETLITSEGCVQAEHIHYSPSYPFYSWNDTKLGLQYSWNKDYLDYPCNVEKPIITKVLKNGRLLFSLYHDQVFFTLFYKEYNINLK